MINEAKMLRSNGSQRGVLGLFSQEKLLHGWSRAERVREAWQNEKPWNPSHKEDGMHGGERTDGTHRYSIIIDTPGGTNKRTNVTILHTLGHISVSAWALSRLPGSIMEIGSVD
jgi:hypothetical protein